jgi:hypothetical protein
MTRRWRKGDSNCWSPARARRLHDWARGTDGSQTLRWREMDSNYWFRIHPVLQILRQDCRQKEGFTTFDIFVSPNGD